MDEEVNFPEFDISEETTQIIEGSSQIINGLRESARRSLDIADEISDLSDKYRKLGTAYLQTAKRIAQHIDEIIEMELSSDSYGPTGDGGGSEEESRLE